MKKQKWYTPYLKDKKITKMGLGPLGRSFGDIVFLVKAGADVLVTDYRDSEDVQASVAKLRKLFNQEENTRLKFVLGKHQICDFEDADMVLSASAVPLDSPYLRAALSKKVPVYTSAALLFELVHKELPDVTTIGITGTKGKSTTTDMIEKMLQTSAAAYHIAGNVRGVANLPVLATVQDGDIILAELDSWQLQGFGFRTLSPDISVFTSFFEDHLNYYRGSMKKYFKDKSYIYKFQNKQQSCFVSKQAKKQITIYDENAQVTVVTPKILPLTWKPKVIGSHNLDNLALAYAVGKRLGLAETKIKKALTSYSSMEGRLELVGAKQGVIFYNDNNSTTPESTIANLKALRSHYSKKGKEPHCVWIGGGADKDFDYTSFAKKITRLSNVQIMFTGKATEKICKDMQASDQLFVADSMKDAITITKEQMKRGSIVILSPAAASFGVFKNEYDRGDQYLKAVRKIINN